jgi:hypothetical protein
MSDNNDFTHELVVYNSDNNNGTQGTGKFLLYDDNINALKVESIDNIKIGGGTNGRILATDGAGNLRWISAAAATGGVSSYNELNDLPTLFDGDYNSLTNKPTYRIAVPTGSGPGGNLQADSLALAGLNPVTDIPSTWGGDLILQGGVGGANGDLYGEVRIKSGQIGANYEWHFTTDKKIKLPAGGDIVDSTGASVLGGGSSFSGSYNDLTNKPTIPADVSNLTDTTSLLFSGSYNDLTNKPTILAEPAFTIKIADFTATAGARYGVNTTSNTVTATLPASPAAGDAIFFADMGGVYSTNNLTILRNGNNIMGISEDLTMSTDNESFGLCWNGTTWRIY